ncbi:MAG: hypothetical protein COU65_00325 [Candidatus Pacebacteria bacterium CG10_big_fil_rev_8_21_14_0_10_42_12]|nr:MAG: hypothetical protein COU65_00325 [Candidatus Pacebacteria bacterium CG10_big_fil_rev_8_21_14_0_10_42_12]
MAHSMDNNDLDQVTLSEEQNQLFEKLENSNSSVFVTGNAGTGKSLLLQYFKTYTKKNIVVVAPTGVAALNVGGQTINSLFRIPPAVITKDKQKSLKLNSTTATLLKNLDTVVIDEISMVRVDMLEAIDYLLKRARKSRLPFGGVQMVMFGDLFQLSPIVTSRELRRYFDEMYGGAYCFNADSWKALNPETIELSTIFRQTDNALISLLNAVRNGNPEQTHLDKLNERVTTEIPTKNTITLATTNQSVRNTNDQKLAALTEKEHKYNAYITGKLEASAFPTEAVLTLKKGAQIMMLKNDREKRWVNGSLGTIKSLGKNEIKVTIGSDTYSVNPEEWSKINYVYDAETKKVEEEVISTFSQFPLRLAWAITIHKSQGQTYESVIVDLEGGAFAHGQTYVALSRCTNLEGLFLKRKVAPRDIIVDSLVVNYMNQTKRFLTLD